VEDEQCVEVACVKTAVLVYFQHQTVLDSACCILAYVADILGALKQTMDRQVVTSHLMFNSTSSCTLIL